MGSPSQDGLLWEEGVLQGPVPTWTREVSIAAVEKVCRQKLNAAADEACKATFHAAGLFNKLYLVQHAERQLLMRVSLPVYPKYKTRAEVATLRWVRKNTRIPVPQVFGFDDSNTNEIGYEWILMELMPGISARRRWRTMTMQQKTELVEQLAAFQVQLSGLFGGQAAPSFRKIGTLNLGDADADVDTDQAAPGRLVSTDFFIGDHIHYDVPRGPFDSSHDWLCAVLDTTILHQEGVIARTDDEDDREDAEEVLTVARKLRTLLPRVFPPAAAADEPEITGLHHQDLHLSNILVDEQGRITAVLDWECVSAMPLWVLTAVPKFLDDAVREDEPQRDSYADETPEEAAEEAEKRYHDPDCLDNEGKNDLYWIHCMEYEATLLRRVYEAKVRALWPAWPLDESRVKLAFLDAITQCDGFWVRKADRWADRMEKGEFVSFADA